MDVWTIQKREILEKVKMGGVWKPDLEKGSCSHLRLCYELALEIYNAHNREKADGLVFAMARTDFRPFASADEIRRLLSDNTDLRDFLRTGRGSLLEEGNVLVRLSYPDSINSVPVDVCAFTAFRPFLARDEEDGVLCIAFDMDASPDPDVPLLDVEVMFPMFRDWASGWSMMRLFRSRTTFLQLHYPSISPDNLTGEEYPATVLLS